MPLASHAHAVNRAQAQRALDQGIKGFGRRLDRLISSYDNLTLIADARWIPRPPVNTVHAVAGRGLTPRNAVATDSTETQRSTWTARQEVLATTNSALTHSRTRSGGVDTDEEADVEEDQMQATMDVYHIGQNPLRCETLATHQSLQTPSYLSKSQQLAEQCSANMFGVRTKYTLRHDGKAPARFATRHNRKDSEGALQHIRSGDTSSSEPSASTVSGYRPLISEASAQEIPAADTFTEMPLIPKLRLDSVPVAPESAQQTMRPQSARFVSARSSTSRPNSARLTMLARHPACVTVVQPRVYLSAAKPLDSPSLRMDFCMLENSMMRNSGHPPRLRVQSARTRSGCQSMSRGHADLPLDTDRASWAAGNAHCFMLGNQHKLTDAGVADQKEDSWTRTKSADVVLSTKVVAQRPTSAVRKPNALIAREHSVLSLDQEYDWIVEAEGKEANAQHEKEVMLENPYFQIDFTEEVSQRKMRSSCTQEQARTKERAPPLIRVNSELNHRTWPQQQYLTPPSTFRLRSPPVRSSPRLLRSSRPPRAPQHPPTTSTPQRTLTPRRLPSPRFTEEEVTRVDEGGGSGGAERDFHSGQDGRALRPQSLRPQAYTYAARREYKQIQSLLTGAEGAGDRLADEEGRDESFQVRGTGAERQHGDVLAQVQAAAARKLQERLAFLDRERLAAKGGGVGGDGGEGL